MISPFAGPKQPKLLLFGHLWRGSWHESISTHLPSSLLVRLVQTSFHFINYSGWTDCSNQQSQGVTVPWIFHPQKLLFAFWWFFTDSTMVKHHFCSNHCSPYANWILLWILRGDITKHGVVRKSIETPYPTWNQHFGTWKCMVGTRSFPFGMAYFRNFCCYFQGVSCRRKSPKIIDHAIGHAQTYHLQWDGSLLYLCVAFFMSTNLGFQVVFTDHLVGPNLNLPCLPNTVDGLEEIPFPTTVWMYDLNWLAGFLNHQQYKLTLALLLSEPQTKICQEKKDLFHPSKFVPEEESWHGPGHGPSRPMLTNVDNLRFA